MVELINPLYTTKKNYQGKEGTVEEHVHSDWGATLIVIAKGARKKNVHF